uniref:Gypsy retrotransposon integrase-like protein 1 n=1 Tax=Terrapene triunguis TaxID=2587831 RepID=A0A674IBQ6_9SAUR
MVPGDDPEAFLVTFEWVAVVAGWAPEQWASILAPYLTGTAQTVYRGLSVEAAQDYSQVKAAILDALDVSPETFRQRFRSLTYATGNAPPGAGEDPSPTTDFCLDQRADPTLQRVYEQLAIADGTVLDPGRAAQWPHFELRQERLYRVERDPHTGETRTQLLVPWCHQRAVMKLAHDVPTAGHLGHEKTLAWILGRFFWPGVHQEVKNYCNPCPDCQLATPARTPKAPLIPMPLIETPFERVAMDLVGPLPKSSVGFQYILVMLDYATRFPEAIPLRNITAHTIADELVKVFARVGLPREILTDQGTNFTSRLLRQVCELLGVKQLRTSVYHPQTDGLVERFNQTLKDMLRKFPQEDLRRWDQLLPPLLLAVREVPQSSTKFSPFELLYGHQPRGLLDLMRETWEQTPSPLQERLKQAGARAQKNLKAAQEAQAQTGVAQSCWYQSPTAPNDSASTSGT